MKTVPELQLLVSESRIDAVVKRMAAVIRQDYNGQNPILIGTLKGAFIFLADLIRYLDIPLEIDLIHLSSYASGTESTGEIIPVHELYSTIKNRHVLLVEDIVDTGLTVDYLYNYLKQKGPASLKLCALLDKPARRRVPVNIDYLGFTVPDKFIVGYGLDWQERYRNLPAIYFIKAPPE